MKKLLTLLLLVIALALANYFFPLKSSSTPVHYHAGFVVYLNGVKQDFSAAKYMNFTACTEHTAKKNKEQEQLEKAHLHDFVGDVVHVHRPGALWGDLFRNLNFTFPPGTAVVGYLDGQLVPNILTQPIHGFESVVIVVGNPANVDLNSSVPTEHIKAVEAQSELCGS